MSMFSNLVKTMFGVPEMNFISYPISKLFLNELQNKGSKILLEPLSNNDILMLIKILKTEVEIREESKDLKDYKNAGIGVNYDSNSNSNDNTNKSNKTA